MLPCTLQNTEDEGLGFSLYYTTAYTVFSALQEDIEKCCIVVVRDQVGFKIGPSLKSTTLDHLQATQEDYNGEWRKHGGASDSPLPRRKGDFKIEDKLWSITTSRVHLALIGQSLHL